MGEFQNRSSNPEERLDTGKAAWDKASENYQLPVMVTKHFFLASCSAPIRFCCPTRSWDPRTQANFPVLTGSSMSDLAISNS